MNRGMLSKLRQNRYASSGVVLRMTLVYADAGCVAPFVRLPA